MIEGRTGANGNVIFENRMRVFVQKGNNSDFRTSKENNSPVPAIGIGAYYPDVNKMPMDYTQLKIGVNMNDTHTR